MSRPLPSSLAPARPAWALALAALALALGLGLGVNAWRLGQGKLGQFLRYPMLAGLVPQGDAPPTSRGIIAVEGYAEGTVLLARPLGASTWLQRFDASLEMQDQRLLPQRDWVGLAVLGQDMVLSDARGALLRVGPRLQTLAELDPQAGPLGALESSLDGMRLLAISGDGRELLALDPLTLQRIGTAWRLPEARADAGQALWRLALTGQGRLAVMLRQNNRAWIAVADPGGGFSWVHRLPIKANNYNQLGAAGETLVVNDAGGPLGVLAYDAADGRYRGHGVVLGAREMLATSGHVSGHRGDGRVYFHYPPGLRQGSLP
jgi:hypothetical protein